MPERHFPPPWSVGELDSCFVVKDANGQALAYMYFEKEPRRRFRRDELLTRDEPQRIRRQLRQTFSGLLRRQHGSRVRRLDYRDRSAHHDFRGH